MTYIKVALWVLGQPQLYMSSGIKKAIFSNAKLCKCHFAAIYEETGCENCNRKEKCTRGKKRKINIDHHL
jgi:hypothetical protein